MPFPSKRGLPCTAFPHTLMRLWHCARVTSAVIVFKIRPESLYLIKQNFSSSSHNEQVNSDALGKRSAAALSLQHLSLYSFIIPFCPLLPGLPVHRPAHFTRPPGDGSSPGAPRPHDSQSAPATRARQDHLGPPPPEFPIRELR